jgi:hypothetical protein
MIAIRRGTMPRRAERTLARAAAELHYRVTWYRPGACWLVRLGDDIQGRYADKEHALLDAVDAAADARKAGRDAEVWDQSTAERVF